MRLQLNCRSARQATKCFVCPRVRARVEQLCPNPSPNRHSNLKISSNKHSQLFNNHETIEKMGREGFVPYQMWSDRFGEEGNSGTNREALLD